MAVNVLREMGKEICINLIKKGEESILRRFLI